MPTLGRICETMDFVVARLPKALAKVWDGDKMVRLSQTSDEVDRPGLYREHIFDFHSGLRLIVSLESHAGDSPLMESQRSSLDPEVILHVSASWDREGDRQLKSLEDLQSLVKGTLEEMGLRPDLAEKGILTQNVLHIVYGVSNTKKVLIRLGIETSETKNTGQATPPV